MKKLRSRLLEDESGFTLPELLVTMLMMLTVMFALYGIFDMSIKVFSYGNDKVEAVENARIGLERMEREIRAAYPYDNTASPPPDDDLFKIWTSNRITFGNELTGDRRILCPALPSQCEVITYDVYKPTGSTTYALGRVNSSGGSRQSVVEFVNYASATSTGLTFKYFTESGAEINSASPGSYTEADIAKVQISLDIKVPGVQDGTQDLTTSVDLRNR